MSSFCELCGRSNSVLYNDCSIHHNSFLKYRREYLKKWRNSNKSHYLNWLKNYRSKNKAKVKLWEQRGAERRKKRAFEILGGSKCVNCGCDDIRFLEINHLLNRLSLSRKEKICEQRKIYKLVISKSIDISTLNVLCKICNALFYFHVKYGKDASDKFKVIWNG